MRAGWGSHDESGTFACGAGRSHADGPIVVCTSRVITMTVIGRRSERVFPIRDVRRMVSRKRGRGGERVDRMVIVMLDVRRRHWDQNPYVWQLANSMPETPAIRIVGFSWLRAVFGRYDVFHAQWPEYLVRGKKSWIAVIKSALCTLFAARMQAQNVPVVQTLHNDAPHDAGSQREERFLRRLAGACVVTVVLRESHRPAVGNEKKSVLIPHPSYRLWLDHLGIRPGPPKGVDGVKSPHFLLFGVIKPYKNIETAIQFVAEAQDDLAPTLTIAGAVGNAAYFERIRAETAGLKYIKLKPGRLSEAELIQEVLACDAVVLPYEKLGNSGVLFYALSLNRPVVVRDWTGGAELQSEFGSNWIRSMEPDQSVSVAAKSDSVEFPIYRQPAEVGAAYAGVYWRASKARMGVY